MSYYTYLDIDITPVHRSISYDPPKHPINVHGPLENINKGLRISGYEINFGFWSKDSYRSYSAYDYLREKLGREPT